MNERELIIFKSIAPTLDLHEKYFILINMLYTVKGSIIHNVINFCFMKGTSNRLVVVLCWIDHVWSSKECVCCACDPNERLSAPSICFVCVFVCRKLSPHLGV